VSVKCEKQIPFGNDRQKNQDKSRTSFSCNLFGYSEGYG